jgi:NAD(P)-dependent dehydrogenase (short-subunit alcohol dehydrogenase family)
MFETKAVFESINSLQAFSTIDVLINNAAHGLDRFKMVI